MKVIQIISMVLAASSLFLIGYVSVTNYFATKKAGRKF